MISEGAGVGAAWREAGEVLALHAVDPIGTGGVVLRGRPGPARDVWLAALAERLPEGARLRRVPPGISDDRLIGGLDLAATLATGRPVEDEGLLAEADGGMLLLAMAERMEPRVAARIAQALETREVRLERNGLARVHPTRFGVVALDEGEPEEAAPAVLLERLAFRVDLASVTFADLEADVMPAVDAIAAARARLAEVELDEEWVRVLCESSILLGIDSLGAVQRAVHAARAAAALDGEERVGESQVRQALRLVLLPRATRLPESESESESESEAEARSSDASDREPAPPEAPEADDRSDAETSDRPPRDDTEAALDPERVDDGSEARERERRDADAERSPPASGAAERLVAAVSASMPPNLLTRLDSVARGGGGRPGEGGRRAGDVGVGSRGRAVGSRRGRPGSGARLDLLETLRAAAPWQPLRRREREARPGRSAHGDRPRPSVEVRRDDFRIVRTRPRTQTTTIFVVDASGSTALRRLGEAKGAVERLLAESYARRDRVALLAFRGDRAELLLPPTRSLVRVKRELRGLPGGGGTPLATGIESARRLAAQVRRDGGRPLLVFLSDGQANVSLAGIGGRPQAVEDARQTAARLREDGVPVLFVDTSTRSRETARDVASSMGAEYVLLPNGRSESLTAAVRRFGADASNP